MNGEKGVSYLILAGITLVVALVVYGEWKALTAKPLPPPAPVVTVEGTPDPDAWVLSRLRACDSVCGPVPLEVTATKDSITCTCGRPERLPPMRVVPKPTHKEKS